MGKNIISRNPLNNERGVSMILMAILLAVFIGFTALAIDYGHLYMVRNELRNAADAGALAGGRKLYTDDGTAITATEAIDEAIAAATANKSERIAVQVSATDIEIGHWSFINAKINGGDGFTASANPTVLDFWNYTTHDLDINPEFINAIRVTVRNPSIVSYFALPILSFFTNTNKGNSFWMEQKAVAWLGYEGSIPPGGVDEPIAICSRSLTDPTTGKLTCNVGRMLNSGSNIQTANTGGWTNFSQNTEDTTCSTANRNSVDPLICGNGNTIPIYLGKEIGTTNGTVESIFPSLLNCWKSNTPKNSSGIPINTWTIKLAVIDCGDLPGPLPCQTKPTGTVELKVVWMVEKAQANGANAYDETPLQMSDWTCQSFPNPTNGDQRKSCWTEFVGHFNLQDGGGTRLSERPDLGYMAKSIYFLPACTPGKLSGTPGGENYGVLAKQPRLVDWSNPYYKF